MSGCLFVCQVETIYRRHDWRTARGGLRIRRSKQFFIMVVIRNCCILSTLNHLAALDFLHLTVAIIYRYIQFLNYSVVTSLYETLGAIYINDLWNFRNL